MMDNKYWNEHPEIKNIVKYANYIDRKLDENREWKLPEYSKTICLICDYYKFLLDQKFIDSLPFYGPSPKGLRSGVNTILPDYAIADFLIGAIQIQLSNFFNNGNSPELSLLRDEKNIIQVRHIIEKLRINFSSHPKFQSLVFMNQDSELSIKQLIENELSYKSICEVFGHSQ